MKNKKNKTRGTLLVGAALTIGCLMLSILILFSTVVWGISHPMSRFLLVPMCILVAMLLCFALVMFYRGIYLPLRELDYAMSQFEGEKGRPVVWNSAQRIAESISKLRNDLESSIEREHEEALLRQQFQYAELQNQINPHFLYNTLETIRGQAIIDDNYKIADMTETLAKYFRYNISKNKDDVTLQQELDNIQNYVKIQQYRFQDRFRFQIVAHADDEEYAFCLIPKMTLQPIVENSIFHGIEQKLEPGAIEIHICATPTCLSILVSDNGVGMDEEQLERLRNSLDAEASDGDAPNQSDGNGIAMRNVHKRLKMLYGAPFGLHVTSTKDLGTDVEITLPRIFKNQDI